MSDPLPPELLEWLEEHPCPPSAPERPAQPYEQPHDPPEDFDDLRPPNPEAATARPRPRIR